MWRWSEGWRGEQREYDVMSTDKAIMLVVCPAGRHDDEREAPQYSVQLQPAGHMELAPGWACARCTYQHAGKESQFLACAVCGAARHSGLPDAA